MKICFVDSTNFKYDASFLYSHKLRAAETVLINLSAELYKQGHHVTIINNCNATHINNGIRWININYLNKIEKFDLVIANGDCNLFKFAKSPKRILFSHSIQNVEKFIRKKQLLNYLKYRPRVCFLSNYHKIKRPKLLYLFGYIKLKWAVDEIFLKTSLTDKIDNNLGIFTSHPDRNLNLLLDIWSRLIIKNNKKIKILVSDNKYKFYDKSIIRRKLGNHNNLKNDLLKSRVCLLPGHKAELFCLAAEEAKELCVPIVTMGIGSLSERVDHGLNGFIAKNDNEFAYYTLKLFNDNILWSKLRNNLIKERSTYTWKHVAKDLIRQV